MHVLETCAAHHSSHMILQWFLRQIENYFLAAQEQGKERMDTVVANDDLKKFAGTKYSASVRDLLKIAFEVPANSRFLLCSRF